MITLRKLARLPDGTRRRKIVRILESLEREPASASESYTRGLLELIANDAGLPRESAARARQLATQASTPSRRAINALRHGIMRALGVEPADWDLAPPASSDATGPLPGTPRSAGIDTAPSNGRPGLENVVIFAEDIRSPFNLGSIVRTAAAFGVRQLITTPTGALFQSKRFGRSAMGADAMVDLSVAPEAPESGGELIALETGGVPVAEFCFPRSGVLMVGSEELGLSPAALSAAKRRVSIPLPGAKGSLNVGVAVGVALSWWAAGVACRPTD